MSETIKEAVQDDLDTPVELELEDEGSDDIPEKGEKRSDTREYLVFQEGNSGNWAEYGKPIASNADQAIKAIDPKEGVRYAAVPVRNWSVAKAKIKVETTTTLEFE